MSFDQRIVSERFHYQIQAFFSAETVINSIRGLEDPLMVLNMRRDQFLQILRHFPRTDRSDTVLCEYRICFHYRAFRQVRNLKRTVGKVDIVDDTGETEKRLHEKNTLFSG